MPDGVTFPAWALVVQARERSGLSQRELAARASTSQSAIARYERGRAMPDLATLMRLVHAAGFDLRCELVPRDDVDERQIKRQLALTPAQRMRANRNATRLLARAAAARRPDAVDA